MPSAIYQHYTDLVGWTGTTITASAADSNYPVANLCTPDPTKPAKLTTTTGWWKVYFGATRQRVDIVALIHHNLQAGLEVRIQGNDTDTWTSPTLNTTFTLGAQTNDGLYPNCWLDLTGVSGYTTNGFYYWRLYIVGTNGVNCGVGCLWLGKLKRTLERNLLWGSERMVLRKIVEHQTARGVSSRYDLGHVARGSQFTVDASPTGASDIDAWWRSCKGQLLPSLLIPDPTADDAWLGLLLKPQLSWTRAAKMSNVFKLEFVELVRGLLP